MSRKITRSLCIPSPCFNPPSSSGTICYGIHVSKIAEKIQDSFLISSLLVFHYLFSFPVTFCVVYSANKWCPDKDGLYVCIVHCLDQEVLTSSFINVLPMPGVKGTFSNSLQCMGGEVKGNGIGKRMGKSRETTAHTKQQVLSVASRCSNHGSPLQHPSKGGR